LNKNRIKVLFVSTRCGFISGIERYIYDAATALKNGGFAVDGMFKHKCRDSEIFSGIFNTVFDFQDFSNLKCGDYDLVFIHLIDDPELLKQLRLKFKTAVVIHDLRYQRHPLKMLTHPIRETKRRRLLAELRQCNAYAVTSRFMRNEVMKNDFDVAKIVKIYPVCQAAPPRTLVRKNTETPIILFVGQLIKEKGILKLMESMSMVQEDFKLWIIGEGSEEKRCRRLASRLGLASNIEFMGWQQTPSDYYAKADIAVFPTIWKEPFGLPGIEANANGLPVIAYDVGGVSEWLHHERNGMLISPCDIRSFADAVEILIRDPGFAGRLGDEGRKWVSKNLSEENYISGFKLMLDRIHSR